ncbi:MAG TPA: serpin family protein [Gemmatimonadaceae bacterium]|jgi:serpin B
MTDAPILCRTAALVAAMMAVISCGGSTPPEPSGTTPIARTDLPQALSAPAQQVRNSANAFSFALWQKLNAQQPSANLFASPLSASFALGMTLNGAAGGTLDEMKSALQLGSASVADVDAGYKSLIQLLTTLDPSVTMQVANSIWYRNTLTVNKPFIDAVTSSFDATVTPLNFADVPGSLSKINGWVDTKTNHKITSILDNVPADAVMYLINAIYFKASWREKFDATKTTNEAFHGVDGDHTVPLMHRNDHLSYAESATYQAVDLPYGDSSFAMTVILPKTTTTVNDVAASLTADAWTTLTAGFHSGLVDLALPKMKLEWTASLIPELKALGMNAAFTNADFTAMSPAGNQLVISEVKQKAYVDVNEDGTEAAAVTSVGVYTTAAPVPLVVRVDRPFIFAIRERLTGTVLFMGKVVDLP